MRSREIPVALLVLRIGLGVFLLLWSIDKIVAPEQTVKIFQHFYKTPLPVGFAPAVGTLEAALSVAFLAGLWKTWTYGACLALHAISTLSTWKQLLTPFGEHHLFVAAIPVLAAFAALFLLRREDTLFTLGKIRGSASEVSEVQVHGRPDVYSGSATPAARQRESSDRRGPRSRSGATAW